MVTRNTTRTFVIALAAALLAACASGTEVVRPASAQSAAVERAVPVAPPQAFADDDADAFWDSIGDEQFGFVETHP